jgi:hypothetical protein
MGFFTEEFSGLLLILRELFMHKLPTLVREKARIILEVLKNHTNNNTPYILMYGS